MMLKPLGWRWPPRSAWPPPSSLLLADQPRSCICPYELSYDAARYVLKYAVAGCPWHSAGTR